MKQGMLRTSYPLVFSCHLKLKRKRYKAIVIFKHSVRSFCHSLSLCVCFLRCVEVQILRRSEHKFIIQSAVRFGRHFVSVAVIFAMKTWKYIEELQQIYLTILSRERVSLENLTEKFESEKNCLDLVCKLSVHDMETSFEDSGLYLFLATNSSPVSELLVVSGGQMIANSSADSPHNVLER